MICKITYLYHTKSINMFMIVWMIEILMFNHTNIGHEVQTTSNIQILKIMIPFVFIFIDIQGSYDS